MRAPDIDRRTFSRSLGAGALAALIGGCAVGQRPAPTEQQQQRIALGLQTFTVLPMLEADFAGTVEYLARIGYRELETIGSFGRDPAMVRDVFARNGLVTPSQHCTPDWLYRLFAAWTARQLDRDTLLRNWLEAFAPDKVDRVIDEAIIHAKGLGQRYVGWAIAWEQQIDTPAKLAELCRIFNRAGERCAAEGLTFVFHNHNTEFRDFGGYVPYDVILAETDPEKVKLEADFYWFNKAGADPVAYMQRNPGRYKLCHLKDSTAEGEFTGVGKGVVDFARLIAAARANGIEHYYVEYDRSEDPAREVREASEYLQQFL